MAQGSQAGYFPKPLPQGDVGKWPSRYFKDQFDSIANAFKTLTQVLTGVLPAGLVINGDVSATTFNGAAGLDNNAWTSAALTLTSQSGTFTAYTATCYYKIIGKSVFYTVNITITTAGTAAGFIAATLPFTASHDSSIGGIIATTGVGLTGRLSGSALNILKYDSSTPIATGNNIVVSGVAPL